MTTEQKFNCIFCKDTFENKEDLQDHFRKHGDPKYKKARYDSQVPNEKCKEKTEMVSCDVCSQMFPTISKAITHKHKVHPDHDAKYFCQWCGKLFTMKHLYNVHVQSTHDNQDKTEYCFHCDSCDVDFYVASAMLYHNKFFHRQDTDLPDVGQSKKIKLCNQEVVPIYYCAFCGEEYDNKVNLFKHMTDDHADENQTPDEVLKCPLCEAVFFHLDAYEVHLTFHAPDDMYSIQNDLLGEVLDFSLETVPPIIEKVETLENMEENQETDPESTMNAVGIDKFLELAMDQPDKSHVKVKKHKKHKKSKKAAITLDEFLSMNQDVFGEGLDFQGIEEVPTQVVKNQLKYKKKSNNPMNSVTLSDLEKLKNAGIVVRKKVGRPPIVNNLKNTLSKPSMSNEKIFKVNRERELKTSSEVLTKLMNQSNNQIKIVKKSSSDNVKPEQKAEDDNIEEDEPPFEDTGEGKDSEAEPCTSSQARAAIPAKISTPDNEDHANAKSSPYSPTAQEENEVNPEDLLSTNNESDKNINDEDKTDLETPENNEEAPEPTAEVPHEADIRSQEEDNIENDISAKIAEEINESDQHLSDTELDEKHDAFDSMEHHEDDINGDDNQDIDDNNEQSNIKNSAGASLSKLKQLSHLITVKPVSQSKVTTPVERDKNLLTPNPKVTPPLVSPNEKSNISKPKMQAEKDPTLDALKNLSKNITIKSLSTKISLPENEAESDEFDEAEEWPNKTIDKKILVKKIKVETDETVERKLNTSNSPGIATVNKALGVKPNRVIVEKNDNSVQSSNANILKRLPHITSKPLSNKKVNNNPQLVKQPCVAKKVVQAVKKPEEIIEIFDVDDSEDELENNKESTSKVEQVSQCSQNSVSSMDALKNLSKNITIKSNRQQTMTKSMKLVNDIKIEKQNEDSSNNYRDDSNVEALINIQNRNMAHVLKGLCKNITIKQGNSQINDTCQDNTNNTQDAKVPEDNGTSDSDSYPGNVKITEMEQDMSDNEDEIERLEHPAQQDEPIVETPYDSGSEKDDMDEFDDQQDIETEIKASTVQKSHQTYSSSSVNTVCLNNLRNISKNLTIKSLNPSSANKEESSKTVQNHEHFVTTQRKQVPMKVNKQSMKEFQSNNVISSKNTKDSGQFADTSTNSMHQKVSAMNQVNTINKEVTVKTFQTKTMIQEITTTVTKTIKTVNQTVKQEVRNNYQTNGPLFPQKILGMRPNQTKNLQGVVVRHATPNVVRANNTLAQIRPAGTVVRPCKQNMSMRTGMHAPRLNNPRMTVAKQVVAPSTQSKPVGKAIKISPTALVTGVSKRPNTEDVSGPFSCFKKPKESLIPVSDIPTFTNSGEAPAHFTAASHTSSSNITNTKIVKGNSVVTAKQVKSQVNASMQQFSRVNNNSGLKITSSQAKQTQVQERTESSAMKRTTLEAIQKLQKQGLLVKKPRTDINESSRSSNHEGDDSPEETDE